ncbi:MAG: hypothetical protein ACI4V1_02920 [Eubacteriales bacterium]
MIFPVVRHKTVLDLAAGTGLIAPTFTHDGNTLRGKIKVFFMKLAGFPLYSKWSSTDYLAFLQSNGWTVRKTAVLKASFPLTYAECVKEESGYGTERHHSKRLPLDGEQQLL